jgi:hypothetical protein
MMDVIRRVIEAQGTLSEKGARELARVAAMFGERQAGPGGRRTPRLVDAPTRGAVA